MKKSRRTYNGVHLNKKSNTQDVVEQSLTVINGDTPSPGISHETPLPSPQPSVPFPLKGKDSSEISLELPNGLKLKFKGSSGCEAALNLISKIYNANVLPK